MEDARSGLDARNKSEHDGRGCVCPMWQTRAALIRAFADMT
jgi:hypothetical protein